MMANRFLINTDLDLTLSSSDHNVEIVQHAYGLQTEY